MPHVFLLPPFPLQKISHCLEQWMGMGLTVRARLDAGATKYVEILYWGIKRINTGVKVVCKVVSIFVVDSAQQKEIGQMIAQG